MALQNQKMTRQNPCPRHMYEYISATGRNSTVVVSLLITKGIVDHVSVLITMVSSRLRGTQEFQYIVFLNK